MIGLRQLLAVSLERLPRMADFTIWASACERALGMQSNEFIRTYQSNLINGRNLALESSVLFEPLQVIARDGFYGTAAELLDSEPDRGRR